MGFRTSRKHGRLLRILSHIYDMIVLTLYNSPLYTNSGSFVAFKTKYVQNLPWFKNDHRYLVPISLYRGAKKCMTIDYVLQGRRYGVSNYNARLKVISGFFEVMTFLFRLIFKSYK